MLGFRLPFARRKGYGMGASGGGNEGASSVSSLLTSLISYWKLDEASGTRYDSVTATANHLTDNNTVTQAAGPKGTDYAAQFTAANNESLSIADNASLTFTGYSWTFSFWIYADSPGVTTQYIATKDGATREWIYFIRADTSTRLQKLSGVGGDITHPSGVVAATWYFYVIWFDQADKSLHIQRNNGTATNGNWTSDMSDGPASLVFGTSYTGRLARVGYWQRVLTATEKTNLYGGGTPPDYPFTGLP